MYYVYMYVTQLTVGKHEIFIVGLVNAYDFVGNPIMRNLRTNGLLNDSQTTRRQYVYAVCFKGNKMMMPPGQETTTKLNKRKKNEIKTYREKRTSLKVVQTNCKWKIQL